MTKPVRAGDAAVVVIVQNDAETIERSIASYYDHVDRILVSTDPCRGFSGAPITPDDTLGLIRALDRDRKITIVEADFYKFDEPMRNETHQREEAARLLCEEAAPRWIFQVDADEVFLDFPAVLRQVMRQPFARAVFWRWISIFNILPDGRLLVIVDEDGSPILERFPLAHRPPVKLKSGRLADKPSDAIFKVFKWRYEGGLRRTDAVLHYSYAKSEARIREKLSTFGHSREFDRDRFYDLWLSSKTDWAGIKNFHPLTPDTWPALRAFTIDELSVFTGGQGTLTGK